MRIDLLNTGTELLLGQTLNSHAHWLGGEFFQLGLRIQRQVCIPDGDEIRLALLESIPRSDVIVVTGGLGPTSDDITREITAELLGMPLEQDGRVLEHIRAYLARRQRELNVNSYRQAQVPCGARVLANRFGTAPGLYFPPQSGVVDGVAQTPHIFLLPGPPRELKPMWTDEVLPVLRGLLTVEPPLLRNFKLFAGGGDVGRAIAGDGYFGAWLLCAAGRGHGACHRLRGGFGCVRGIGASGFWRSFVF